LEKIGGQSAKGRKLIERFLLPLARWMRHLRRRLTGDGYHPEAHYMRGPGPKTRAKLSGHSPQ
jgi:hypothetical protein